MSGVIHHLIEQYGLVAVFLGCVAEGESAAILGGFFAHQHVFVFWQTFLAAFLGAFAGDTGFFTLGRSFADHPYVKRLRRRPGFRRPSERSSSRFSPRCLRISATLSSSTTWTWRCAWSSG